VGKPSRDKGARRERELVQLCRAWGLKAERVPLSGAAKGSFAGDVDIYKIGRDAPFIGEVKARAAGFKELYKWLDHDGADLLALKADREGWLFVLPEHVFRELFT